MVIDADEVAKMLRISRGGVYYLAGNQCRCARATRHPDIAVQQAGPWPNANELDKLQFSLSTSMVSRIQT